jgi:hypothetical protein
MIVELKTQTLYKVTLLNGGEFDFADSNVIFVQYYSTVISNGGVCFKFLYDHETQNESYLQDITAFYSEGRLEEMTEEELEIFRVYYSEIDNGIISIEQYT